MKARVSARTKEIAKAAFPEYRGRTFREDFSGSVTFYDTNWGGGTRNKYVAVRLSDMEIATSKNYAPWTNPVEGKSISIPGDFAIVKHSIFCGHDMGLTVHFGELVNVEPKQLEQVA